MSDMQSASSQFEGHLFYTKTEGFLRELVCDVLQPLSLTLNKARPCRESKTDLDFGFHAKDSGFQVLHIRFILSGTWISDSLLVKPGLRIPKRILPDSVIQIFL